MNAFGAPSAWLAQAPVILTSQRAHRSLSTPMFRSILRVTDHIVDGVVVNCEAMRRHLIEDEGTPASRIRVCYNGIDTETYFPAPAERPATLQGGATVIGIVCVLRPEKGLPTLIRAFAALRRDFPLVRLLIVGDGPEERSLKELAGSLGLADACQFAPGTHDVARWLRSIRQSLSSRRFPKRCRIR